VSGFWSKQDDLCKNLVQLFCRLALNSTQEFDLKLAKFLNNTESKCLPHLLREFLLKFNLLLSFGDPETLSLDPYFFLFQHLSSLSRFLRKRMIDLLSKGYFPIHQVSLAQLKLFDFDRQSKITAIKPVFPLKSVFAYYYDSWKASTNISCINCFLNALKTHRRRSL
jgi:hypothetical protein